MTDENTLGRLARSVARALRSGWDEEALGLRLIAMGISLGLREPGDAHALLGFIEDQLAQGLGKTRAEIEKEMTWWTE